MSEFLTVAIGIFIRLAVAFAILWGLWRLFALGLSRLPEGMFGMPKGTTWESPQILCNISSGILRFIVVSGLLVFLVGRSALALTDRWVRLSGEIRDTLFLISCAGIFSALVFGLYQDHPPARLKILGVIAAFSALAGIAAG